jgi:alkanesulfonate monooxygenase SsuD/methylene tetrahydromethanopterin reductase-like flavin-dependent oxidoreductase (luciferase family)
MPLVLAIIGGDPARFAPYVDLFHRALAQIEKPDLPIAVHSPGFIADTDDLAAEQYWPHNRVMRDRIGAERGWPPSTEGEFRNEIEHGSLYLGSPETVARKLAATIKTLGIQRFDLKYSAGTLPHELMMHSIELYGSKVLPMVKDILA